MKSVLLACAAIATSATVPAAWAQEDVAEFSAVDEEALLNETPEGSCEQPAADGSCPAVVPSRGWRFGGSRTGTVASPTAPARQNVVTSRQQRAAPITASRSRVAMAPRLLPLQFALGSADLSPQSRANLKNLADALKEPGHSGKHIRITGHTDKSGSVEINQRLSLQRAEAAATYIATLGVARDRIEAVGRAFEAPISGMSEFDPRNRRIEVERIK